MIKVLGLDISSATIGWAIVEADKDDQSLAEYGFLRPPGSKKGSLTYRVSETFDMINEFLEEKAPDIVVIESYANKFPSGKSTARTIIVLSVFNEVVSMSSLRFLKKDPVRYPVVTIRAALSKIAGRKISSKEECFDFVCNHFSNFKLRKNRAGNLSKECYDEADAIAVCLAYCQKEIIGE